MNSKRFACMPDLIILSFALWLALPVQAASAGETRPSDADVLERLARMERAMNQLGVSIEELERELRAARSSVPATGTTTAGSLRDCESIRPSASTGRVFPGRSFSTW